MIKMIEKGVVLGRDKKMERVIMKKIRMKKEIKMGK